MNNEWQPIETAPKDGTLILGWCNKIMRGRGAPFILIWGKYLNYIENPTMCWMDFDRAFPREPTHWMPLPEPPAKEKE